jgi:DNA-binding beta-propeller fold protein YncE
MQLEAQGLKYQWIDNWATIPDTPTGREDGRTHGVAVSKTGDIFIFHQADPAVLRYDAKGNLKSAWGSDYPTAHGMTLVEEDGEERLWLVDTHTAEIVKTTLDGERLQSISRPDHPAYDAGETYMPTWVSVNEQRFGGNGDVWVTDGYGSSLIHRFDSKGNYLSTITGEEGTGGKLKCPHAISFRFTDAGNELFIADRGNKQIQVYDTEGNFKRAFGSDVLNSPCVIAFHGDRLVIPELFARIAILESDGQLVGYLGENSAAQDTEGWPNVAANHIKPGHFNSPHSLAVDPQGNLYIVEWIIGGRVTKLAIR